MKTITSWEAFKTKDGRFQFHYMEGIVLDDDGRLNVARWKNRTSQNDDPSTLYGVQPLQVEDRGPVVRPEWTRCDAAESDLASDGADPRVFVKKPSMLDYTDHGLDARISREIAVCEVLRSRPHPNLAAYHGCCVSASGRVDGLCFQRYGVSLLELCNPGQLNKQAFVARGGQRSQSTLATTTGGGSMVQLHPTHLDGLLAGIRHLHSLGLVHNDINPANILVDGLDTNNNSGHDGNSTTLPIMLVLADFDSCRPTGSSLLETQARRTHGWHDTAVATAQVDNDLQALAEVRAWLFGDVSQLQWGR